MRNKGIKFNPKKDKAKQVMLEPRTEKKVSSFIGHLNYIAQFIS